MKENSSHHYETTNRDERLGSMLRELLNRRGFEFHLTTPGGLTKRLKWSVSFCYLSDSGDNSGDFDTLDECLEYAVSQQNEDDDARR